MQLITKEGHYFIDKTGYEACHDLKHMIPELKRSIVVSATLIDRTSQELITHKNTLAKLRRQLQDIQKVFDQICTEQTKERASDESKK